MNKLVLILASLLYQEGRSEGYIGLHLIADTIWNRADGKPAELLPVITRPRAYAAISKVDLDNPDIPVQANDLERDLWRYCTELAGAMVKGHFTPTTYATHFWRTDGEKQGWMYEMQIVTQYRNHTFAREAK